MTNEKFLEILTDIKGTYAYDDSFVNETQKASQLTNDDLAAFVTALGGTSVLPFIVEQAIRKVKSDISVKSLPSEKVRRLKACGYILNHDKKTRSRECLKYANTIDGIQYISNGFFAAAFKNPLPLEERPESVPLDFKFANLFPLSDRKGKIELELPDRLALESFVKVKKVERKGKKFPNSIKYNFGKDLPLVDAELFIKAMDIFPDGKFYKSGVNAVHIYGSNGDEGILCTMRKSDEDTEKTVLT